ncbi:MAG: YqeG family HAD IIIA-type phosphatase [Deinococcota bacterium]
MKQPQPSNNHGQPPRQYRRTYQSQLRQLNHARLRWYLPDWYTAAVTEIHAHELTEQGIQAVMVDLDDTLLGRHEATLQIEVIRWVASLRAAGLKVLILSNGTPQRVKAAKARLGIDGFALVGKPWRVAYQRGLRQLSSTPRTTVMIGDQLFTDILGANLMKINSILVRPLSKGSWHTQLLRHIEKLVLQW